MKLQLAIDMVDTEKALEMVSQISDVVDIVEVGTPMIVREGMAAVTAIKKRYPDITVLADVKIVDGGGIESSDAFEAGADIVTVLGFAADETISDVVSTARRYGRKTMADMISIENVTTRAAELDGLGLDYICVHTAVDVQRTGKSPYGDLLALMPLLKSAGAAVAGGVSLSTIPLIKRIGPDIIVAGSSLTKAADLRKAVIEMKTLMNS